MMRSPDPLVTDRVRMFDLDADDLWAALVATDRYTTWWPWLREFDGTAVAAGQVWSCTVRSPFGYRVRCSIRLDEVHPAREVRATVSGDVAGLASVTLERCGSGSSLRFVSRLTPVRPLLRRLTRWAPRVARRGHDHVVTTGLNAFATETRRSR